MEIDKEKEKYIKILKTKGIEDEVEKVEIIEPNWLGEHAGSSIQTVKIQFTNKEIAPLYLFVKNLPNNPGQKEIINEMNLFAKEAAFFHSFLPSAKEFCANKVGSGEWLDFFPKCYYGDDQITVLENLKEKGYIMLKMQEYQDFDEARLVLKNLSQLHAVSFAMIQEMGLETFNEQFPIVGSEAFSGEQFEKLMRPMFDNSIRTAINILKEHPTDGGEEAVLKLQTFVGKAFEKVMASIHSKSEKNELIVLNHGDCWNNNMLFLKNSGSGKIEKHIFIDLQVTRIGSPNLDICYFLFTSVKPEVRRNHFMTLMKIYFENFVETVKVLGGTVDFTLDDLLSDFKKRSALGYFMAMTSNVAPGAFAEMDLDNMDSDTEKRGQQMDQIIANWIQRNPEETNKIAKEIVATLNEYLV